jgi:hypothetical protein
MMNSGRNTRVMLSMSVLVGSLMGIAMPNDGWPQGLDKARQELQQLGTQAAEHAKKAEHAAQEAEQLANKLSGTSKNDAQQAAQDARQKATQAKAKADQIQGRASQSGDIGNVDNVRQAAQDAKQMGDEAQGHAKRAKDVAGSFSGTPIDKSNTDLTPSSDQSGAMDAGSSTSSQKRRNLRNSTPSEGDMRMGPPSSTNSPKSRSRDESPSGQTMPGQ